MKITGKYVKDLAERVAATFGAAFVAALLAAGPANLMHLSTVKAAALAGLAAVLSLGKGLAARLRGNSESASLTQDA